MCLILTLLFLVLATQAAMQGAWGSFALYGVLALLFAALLVNNVKAVLRHKGKCGPDGCSVFDFFKRAPKQVDDDQLGDE